MGCFCCHSFSSFRCSSASFRNLRCCSVEYSVRVVPSRGAVAVGAVAVGAVAVGAVAVRAVAVGAVAVCLGGNLRFLGFKTNLGRTSG